MAEAKKALQDEVVAVKQRWSAEVKLAKAAKDAPNYPLPIAVSRTIQRPEAADLYDVDELTVKLWVDSLEASEPAPVRVEVAGALPETLQKRVAAAVDERWRGELRARGSGKGFLLEKVLAWAEGAYTDLITLEPSFVEAYEACDAEGRTIRRYAIAEPPPPAEEKPIDVGDDDSDDDESEEEEEEEEDIDARVAKMKLDTDADRQMRIKLKAEAEADRQWREERRKEAEAQGEDYGGPKPVSKKEQNKLIAEKRETQGKRLRKQGAKSNKFDAEAAGKKKNGKNSLLH